MAIRYDAKINSELLRVVRNYNSKIRRIERQGANIPLQRVRVRDIRKQFMDRRDLVRYINDLRKFGQRGMENIVYIEKFGTAEYRYTKFDIETGRSLILRAKREGKRLLDEASRRKNMPFDETAQRMGLDYDNLIVTKLNVLNERKYTKNISLEQRARLIRNARSLLNTEKQSKYIFGLFKQHITTLGDRAKAPAGLTDKIISGLSRLEAGEFEIARSQEELIQALEEEYDMLKYLRGDDEYYAWGSRVVTLMQALADSMDTIIADYITE